MNTEVLKSGSYHLFVLTMTGTSRWGTRLNEQDKRIYGISKLELKDIYRQMLDFDDTEDEDLITSLEEEIEILDEAYRNAFKVITGAMSIQQLLDDAEDMIFLPFDPSVPETFMMIADDMIQYFEDAEEYEKCSEIMKIKEKLDDA